MLIILACATACPPALIPPPADLPTAEAVVAALAERRTRLSTLSGRASVQRRGPQGRERVAVRMWVARPASVRFEAIGPMNQTLGVLVASEGRFGLFAAQEGRYYHGPATATNLGRLFGLALVPGELVEVLLGGAPAVLSPPGRVEWDGERGLVRYRPPSGPGEQLSLWVDHRDLAVRRLEARDAEGRLLHVLLADAFEDAGGVLLARRLRFERHWPVEEEVLVKVRRFRVNPTLAEEAFRYEPPEGVPHERVD